ncbi:hypothetical protein [Streptomyces broussonetiae]|uniref:Uncharacterized protein n=1 Tax=Streptomyces broussonetiae TaxID=2686304 RepID=A0A6I6N159_9ACTN|nr:hypothetical protein [Streptomyces broussonetiae]QHA02555.1 hypothetical protein GQF42_03955 [Streptomyces broussonetiae]
MAMIARRVWAADAPGAQAVDPRARETALRPWFVVFDADVATRVCDGDTPRYDTPRGEALGRD